jgi:ankyrin repeat protein
MEDLFNPDRPHFAAWRMLRDIDIPPYPAQNPFCDFVGPDGDRGLDVTPLYYAALCGFHDLTQHLIVNHPQHVNAPCGRYYIAPLDAALGGNYFQIAELLLQHGADVDVRSQGGWTPLLSVSFKDNPEIVEWLLNHGADANARLDGGATPLHFAGEGGHPQIARMLLDHKADINAETLTGLTSLHVASGYGNVDVAELLLRHGVDVNARDNAHSTPLHLASGKAMAWPGPYPKPSSLEVVCLLLKHGADVEAKDVEGRTAFHFAESKGHYDLAKLLSEDSAK